MLFYLREWGFQRGLPLGSVCMTPWCHTIYWVIADRFQPPTWKCPSENYFIKHPVNPRKNKDHVSISFSYFCLSWYCRKYLPSLFYGIFLIKHIYFSLLFTYLIKHILFSLLILWSTRPYAFPHLSHKAHHTFFFLFCLSYKAHHTFLFPYGSAFPLKAHIF